MTDRCTHARFSSSNTRKSTTVMSGGLLSLKWNHHRSTFLHILRNVRQKELYSDVTIACDGKFYNAHKLVLATCSEYFEGMFEQTACKQPVIVLKDIGSEELEALLSYMYDGEVNVLQENLSSLIKAAECLRIKGLAVADSDPSSQSRSTTGSSSNRITDAKKSHHGSSSDSGSNKQNSSVNNTKESVLSNSNNRGIKRTHHSNTNSKDNEVLLKRRKDNVENGERFRNNDVSHHSDSNSSFAEGDNAAVKTEPVDVPDADDILHQFDDDNAPLPTEDTSNAETEDTHRNDAGESNQSDSNAPDFIEEKFDGASHGGGPEDDGDDTITGDPPSDAWRGAATSEDDADMFSPSDAGTSSFTGQPGNSLTLDNTASNSSSVQHHDDNSMQHCSDDPDEDSSHWLWNSIKTPPSNNSRHGTTMSYPSKGASAQQLNCSSRKLSRTQDENISQMSAKLKTDNEIHISPECFEESDSPEMLSPLKLSMVYSLNSESARQASLAGSDGPRGTPVGRTYKCVNCDGVFIEKNALYSHECLGGPVRHLTCVWPYCDYRTFRSDHMKIHLRKHTGERPYKCPHCDYRCNQKSQLNGHIAKKHMEDYIQIRSQHS